jgi:hypothetical protein
MRRRLTQEAPAVRPHVQRVTRADLAPGSDTAVAQGCTCPVQDNARGLGRPSRNGARFVVDSGCPVHGAQQEHKP